MFKRELVCSVCGREVKVGEAIYAKMTVPKRTIMVEIKAYLQKKSDIICPECVKEIGE